MPALESRLAAVERQLRFQRLIIAGLLIALVALVGFGAAQGVPDQLRAKSLIVGDKDSGLVVIGPGPAAKGTGVKGMAIVLTMPNQKPGMILGPDVQGTYALNLYGLPLNMRSESGSQWLVLSGKPTAGGFIGLLNADGKLGATVVGGGSNSPPSLGIWDDAGHELVQVTKDDAGRGFVGAFDSTGKGSTLAPR